MRKKGSLVSNLDWALFSVFILLLFMGLATVYSVAYSSLNPSLFDLDKQYGKQIIWILISLFIGFLIFLMDAHIYKQFAFPIYIFTLFLLIVVLFMPPINGARAWIGLGSMGIQPAEFSKIASSLLMAKYISELSVKQQSISTVFKALAIILIPMTLILLQPDAGTFVVFTSFLFVMYREGMTFDPLILYLINKFPGYKLKYTLVGSHFIPILLIVLFLSITTLLLTKEETNFYILPFKISGSYYLISILLVLSLFGIVFIRQFINKRDKSKITVAIIIGFFLSSALSYTVDSSFGSLASHQKVRIELFLGLKEDPNGKDYNRNRAMTAVGSGGFIGKGYNKASLSSVESNHVPESDTDFIFCSFAEEWGFIGSMILILLYMFMLIRIVFIAERQKSSFTRIYAYCVGMILFFHFAINIGMSIGFAPVIGIPLPFFSCGGSSTLSFSIMIFILLKLDSQRKDILS